MDNQHAVLYVESLRLAKALGDDPSQVPQPFQLNELENYHSNATAAYRELFGSFEDEVEPVQEEAELAKSKDEAKPAKAGN